MASDEETLGMTRRYVIVKLVVKRVPQTRLSMSGVGGITAVVADGTQRGEDFTNE